MSVPRDLGVHDLLVKQGAADAVTLAMESYSGSDKVQAVGGRVRTQFDRMWAADEPKCGRLVVIAEHDHLDIPAIEAVLAG